MNGHTSGFYRDDEDDARMAADAQHEMEVEQEREERNARAELYASLLTVEQFLDKLRHGPDAEAYDRKIALIKLQGAMKSLFGNDHDMVEPS